MPRTTYYVQSYYLGIHEALVASLIQAAKISATLFVQHAYYCYHLFHGSTTSGYHASKTTAKHFAMLCSLSPRGLLLDPRLFDGLDFTVTIMPIYAHLDVVYTCNDYHHVIFKILQSPR